MKQHNWVVIGIAVAVVAAGIGIGLAIRHARSSAARTAGPVVPDHHQRAERAEEASAQRSKAVRQQREQARRNYGKMSPEQRGQMVRDQVHRTLEPNDPRRQAVVEAAQKEYAQLQEKLRDLSPDQRKEYLRQVAEGQRAKRAAAMGLDPNRPADANTVTASSPADGNGPVQTATGR